MNKIPRVNIDHLVVGSKFMCLDATAREDYFTVGKIYEMIDIRKRQIKSDMLCYWFIDDDNDIDDLYDFESIEVRANFTPMSEWEEEDIFLFRIGGIDAIQEQDE